MPPTNERRTRSVQRRRCLLDDSRAGTQTILADDSEPAEASVFADWVASPANLDAGALMVDHDGVMEIPALPETTILMVEVGSTAHGTGIDGGEDHDQLAVVVETPEQLLGLDEQGFKTVMQRTQPEGSRSGPGDIDRTLHSLRRFVRMAAAGNPSILMTMWAPVEYSTPLGEELQALGEDFIGRHVVPRYQGYMQAQAQRLLGVTGGGHGKRGGGGREELINEFGYDTKYGMHCARLGFQCLELLSTGKLELPIQGEPAEWLRAVRYGKIDLDEWWERSLELDAQLEAIGDDQSIRASPDREKIDTWCISAHRRIWAGDAR